jgi:2-dehydro-3-deoxyphosphogluconate aldolase/(4S)-4-hydroxy-2-oxoglutarate aldolase
MGLRLCYLVACRGLPNVVACGGSWMVLPSLIAAGDFATITRLTSEALSIAAVAKRTAA